MELIDNTLEPRITTDTMQDGTRYVSAECSSVVCSKNILMSLTPTPASPLTYVINKVQYVGGCQGNTTGVCRLVQGMKVADVITRLDGINCRGRGTSCPDQLARVLKQIRDKEVTIP